MDWSTLSTEPLKFLQDNLGLFLLIGAVIVLMIWKRVKKPKKSEDPTMQNLSSMSSPRYVETPKEEEDYDNKYTMELYCKNCGGEQEFEIKMGKEINLAANDIANTECEYCGCKSGWKINGKNEVE